MTTDASSPTAPDAPAPLRVEIPAADASTTVVEVKDRRDLPRGVSFDTTNGGLARAGALYAQAQAGANQELDAAAALRAQAEAMEQAALNKMQVNASNYLGIIGRIEMEAKTLEATINAASTVISGEGAVLTIGRMVMKLNALRAEIAEARKAAGVEEVEMAKTAAAPVADAPTAPVAASTATAPEPVAAPAAPVTPAAAKPADTTASKPAAPAAPVGDPLVSDAKSVPADEKKAEEPKAPDAGDPGKPLKDLGEALKSSAATPPPLPEPTQAELEQVLARGKEYGAFLSGNKYLKTYREIKTSIEGSTEKMEAQRKEIFLRGARMSTAEGSDKKAQLASALLAVEIGKAAKEAGTSNEAVENWAAEQQAKLDELLKDKKLNPDASVANNVAKKERTEKKSAEPAAPSSGKMGTLAKVGIGAAVLGGAAGVVGAAALFGTVPVTVGALATVGTWTVLKGVVSGIIRMGKKMLGMGTPS